MSLADSLEAAAEALSADADSIRPANGDPSQLLSMLGAEGATRVMSWLLANEPAAAEELAAGWLDDERGAEPLLQISEQELPKPGRKVLRRTLHRLRSRGIEAASAAPRQPRVARLPEVEDELEAAYVTALDPRGARLVFLVEANPAGGARLFEALLDEAQGIVDFQIYNAGRSKVRAFVKEATRRSGPQAVEAAPESVRVLIARSAAQHPSERPLPRSFSEWRKHLVPADEACPTPGAEVAARLGGASTPEQQSRAAELVRGGTLGPWPPHNEVLKELVDHVSSHADSEIVISDATQQSRLDDALGEAAKMLFGDQPFAERTARRFEESAYVFAKTDREEDARACLAAAQDLRGDAPEGSKAAQAIIETLLGPLLESLQKKNEGEDAASGSLLVKP